MYIPRQRTLRLVEIQESVLPEEEYIMGISDLGYFQGVGFSMPIPFDREYFKTSHKDLLSGQYDGSDIELSGPDGEISLEFGREEGIEQGEIVSTMNSDLDGISHGCDNTALSPQPLVNDRVEDLLESMEMHTENLELHAFLPGRFYCSRHMKSVDGVLIEVDQHDIMGMTLTSFRPEDVHSFDVETGLVIDTDGRPREVKMDLDALGKFRANLLREVENDTNLVDGASSLKEINYIYEIGLAAALADKVQLENLKRAYVSGASVAGRIMNLYDDIEKNGMKPVFRIYLRNRKHPRGTIVDLTYRSLEGILELTDWRGIDCPDEMDLGLELRRLSFSKLAGNGVEVDIEQAILETYAFMEAQIGSKPSLEQIITLLFSQEDDS
ncbi:hypothetical protein EU538_08825 [Candidatus Thorarchaeota archaeon]|nr:MAG: hypothetical protein EU538_08825 [Candidatus Thorarchaeota archaeon]